MIRSRGITESPQIVPLHEVSHIAMENGKAMVLSLRGLGLVFGIVTLLCPGVTLGSGKDPVSRFATPQPGFTYEFPRDHGTHNRFQSEWWYFTGHLKGPQGERFGYELTFFRYGVDQQDVWDNPSPWSMRQIFFAHFALTDIEGNQFHFSEKLSRAGIEKAGARKSALHVWIDRWFVKAVEDDHRHIRLFAEGKGMAIDLLVSSLKPPVIQGVNGVSQKGSRPEHASHYYSMTRLRTSGMIQVKGTSLSVEGLSWMDHEFGTANLPEGLVGWDWFSLQLDNNHEMMVYGLRGADGTFDAASSGTLVLADGTSEHLLWSDIRMRVEKHWTSPVSGAEYPHQWTLSIPAKDIRLTISPIMAAQELITKASTGVTYWEGAVQVTGQWSTGKVTGQGYVELTGYAEPYHLPE